MEVVTDPERFIDSYDALLFDAYGVLVHAGGALPGAVAWIAALRAKRKRFFVVTNDASKLPETAAARYRSLGFDIGADDIITSGSLLERHFRDHALIGRSCLTLGTPDSEAYVRRAGGVLVAPEFEFPDVIIIADDDGFAFLSAMEATLNKIISAVEGGQPPILILPNPDIIYPAETGFGFASGSLALMLEAALELRFPNRPELRFRRLGKPAPDMFDEAAQRSHSKNLLMFGDQLVTDIAGANAFGIDSVLMGSGITTELVEDGPQPTFRLEAWPSLGD